MIRNFGIGGWSVYQAYLRMLREEKRKPGKYIIFNIYEDDSYRNLDSWKNIRRRKHPQFIEPTLPYCKENNKNLLFVLSYPAKQIAQSFASNRRWDQELIDFISEKRLPCIDLYNAHISEFKQYSIEMTQYLEKYFIGHYNPLGNN